MERYELFVFFFVSCHVTGRSNNNTCATPTELYLQETFKPLVHISPDARYLTKRTVRVRVRQKHECVCEVSWYRAQAE